MASSRDRQRALARAKLERQMARRAAAARRRRQIQAGVAAAVAMVLVVLGSVWLVSQFTGDDGEKKTDTAAKTPGPCTYTDLPAEQLQQAKERKDVGKPTAGSEAREGVRVFTLNTNHGAITIELDAAEAPCTVESIAYLTGKKFYDNSPCHRLTTEGLFVLQCGDPSGTGKGGPAYQVNDENLPSEQRPPYPRGVVAMANSGPNTNGSQFFIVYKDTELPASYSIVGEVTAGMEVVEKVAKAGVAGGGGDGKPKAGVTIKTATITAPRPEGQPAPTTSPTPSTDPSKS